MKYYKVLNRDGSTIFANTKYHLPKGKRPGKWMPKIKDNLIMCAVGYHLCRRGDVIDWLLTKAIFEVEIKDGAKIIVGDNKILTNGPVRLVKQMNWDNRIAHLFIADCAERVLPIYEIWYPGDHRIRDAITARRGYANGDISEKEWRAAWHAADAAADAADAASAAAGDGTRFAASAAADAAGAAAKSAASAAIAAALATEWSAAGTISAGWALERKWQTDRLFEYLTGRHGDADGGGSGGGRNWGS